MRIVTHLRHNTGTITYKPTGASVGVDSFSFTVTDQNKSTVMGAFRVTVTPKPAS